MDSHYAYTPYIWPSFLTLLLLIALAIYSWHRRSVPGALPFAIGCLFAALWAAGSVMEAAAVDLATKIFWVKFQGACQLPVATAVTCFFLEYAWPGRWLTRRNLVLLSILCLLTVALVLTDDLLHLVWRGFEFDGTVTPLWGPASWFFFVYACGLAIVNIIACAWLILRSPQHRWPVIFMLTGLISGRIIYLLGKGFIFHSDLPVDMLGMAFEFLMYAIALFGFHILDPIPLARRTAIEQLHAGMLVLDPQRRIVSLNPAAAAILGSPAKRILGRPIQELLPACSDMAGDLQAVGAGQIEISLGTGSETRCYQLEASSLNDWRGLAVGRLLLLHDVSEQKRAQAQILEQQQVVATLQERERLARELHDNLGQVFGYVSMQAQAIRKRVRDGDLAAIETQLTRLAEVAQDAHKEIRESIFGLKSGPTEQWSFFATLRQHLDACQEHYGLRTELVIPAGLREDVFGPGAGVQLLRVIQEAVTNARKHGRAQCVQVSFGVEDKSVRITVADDGCGFELEQLENEADGHYGLAFMRERMAQIGGSLTIDTRPGSGTQVILQVPLHGESEEAER